MKSETKETTVCVSLIGSHGSGKTSLAESLRKLIGNRGVHNNNITIWDNDAKGLFNISLKRKIRVSLIVLLLADLSDNKSWKKLDYWDKIITENAPKCKRFLIGTKKDLACPDLCKMEEFILNHNSYEFIQVSSPDGQNVAVVRDSIIDYVDSLNKFENDAFSTFDEIPHEPCCLLF